MTPGPRHAGSVALRSGSEGSGGRRL